MAINQVSLFFYPARWRQHVLNPGMICDKTGLPLQKQITAVRVENADGTVILGAEVKAWLAERGFVPAGWGAGSILEFGQVRSIFGVEKEIEVTVGEEASEVTDVYCRFTLPKGGLPEIDGWTAFAVALSARFGLRLGADGSAPCRDEEFREAVRRNEQWQDWASQTWSKVAQP